MKRNTLARLFFAVSLLAAFAASPLVGQGATPLISQAATPLAAQDLAVTGAIPSPSDVALPAGPFSGLPEIGKWMIAANGRIASWLGWQYRAKNLFEPINVVIYDGIAKTEEEAYARLEKASIVVEFELRVGHSTGYSALIAGRVFEQLPRGKGQAISDGPFEFANNHGRLFGPQRWKEGWIFTAAFSREFTDLVTKVKHHYASFNQARDAFAWALDREGSYKVEGFIPLGNSILGSAECGTGDHDGLAVYLAARK